MQPHLDRTRRAQRTQLTAVAVAVVVFALTRPPTAPSTLPDAPGALPATTPPTALASDTLLRIGAGGFNFDSPGRRGELRFSGDGKLLALPVGNDVSLYDVSTGELLRTLEGPGNILLFVGLSKDGRLLAAYSWNPAKLRVWDLTTNKVLYTLNAEARVDAEPAFSPDGRWLVIGGHEPTPRLRVLAATTGVEVKSIPTSTWGYGRFNPAGTRYAASFTNLSGVSDPHPDQDVVTVWDTTDWRVVGKLTPHRPRIPTRLVRGGRGSAPAESIWPPTVIPG